MAKERGNDMLRRLLKGQTTICPFLGLPDNLWDLCKGSWASLRFLRPPEAPLGVPWPLPWVSLYVPWTFLAIPLGRPGHPLGSW